MGFDNIIQAKGIGIALTGLTIVFVALTMISVFIALLPHATGLLSALFPEEQHKPAKSPAPAEEELVAAIGFAMHQRKR